ncbi:hypothetical protein KSC_109100 [Ktedonobacter sp. SOSP1-52]|nr:hypothetical protein KSC_109100 [Ktedonobacter sp. SOSP1-52]
MALQGKTALGGFLQRVSSWSGQMGETCGFMHFHATIPRLCGFHLSSFEALEECRRQMIQLIDFYRLHAEHDSRKE